MLIALSAAADAMAEVATHDGPALLGLNAEEWVYVSITIFLLGLFFFGRAHHRIASALDARIADAKRQLDEAAQLRAEAEALLARAKAQQAASAGDAQAIIAHAEQEAADLIAQAEKDAADLTARRAKMAEDKIAAAERSAIAEVRAQAAEAATRAAAALIAERHDPQSDKALVDRTIADIAQVH